MRLVLEVKSEFQNPCSSTLRDTMISQCETPKNVSDLPFFLIM